VVTPVEVSREDYRTAMADLGATDEQALAITVMACAWRLSVVSVAVGLLALVVAAVLGTLPSVSPRIALAAVAPLVIGFLVSLPFAFAGALHSFRRGVSRDARLRFGNGGAVYVYYGWRYAFRGRRRPWGAMTAQEQQVADPRRFNGE
jgi:hypothetical protein